MSGSQKCKYGCGRIVSANKDTCRPCAEDTAAFELRRQEEAMEAATHVMVKHRSVDQEDLYRADGMLVASRQKDIVRFGSDISTAQNRPFLSAELASKFVHRLAHVDLVAQSEGKPLHAVIDRYASLPLNALVETRDLEDSKRLVIPSAIRMVN